MALTFNIFNVSGDESLAAELRVRTVIELTAFFDSYYKEYDVSELESKGGVTYDEAIHELAVDGGYASVWGLCGLASVIERPIVSVYPSTVNGLNDELAALLNRQMRPRRNYDADRDAVYIMWTSTSWPKSGTMWRSNHFVPLVKAQPQSTTASVTASAVNNGTKGCNQASHIIPYSFICHIICLFVTYSLFIYLSHFSFISQIIRLYQTQLLNIETY